MGYSVYYCGDVSVEPPLTEEDAATFLEIVNDKRTDRTKDFFDRIAASPEAQIPYSVGLLELSEDGSQILPETDESRAGAGTWLQLVVEHFLVPKGYSVDGEITWNGDEAEIAVVSTHRANRSKWSTTASRIPARAGRQPRMRALALRRLSGN